MSSDVCEHSTYGLPATACCRREPEYHPGLLHCEKLGIWASLEGGRSLGASALWTLILFVLTLAILGWSESRGKSLGWGWSIVLAFFATGVIQLAFEFLGSTEGKVTVITFIVAMLLIAAWSQAQSEKKLAEQAEVERRNAEIRKKIKRFERGDHIPGFRVTKDLGWVRTGDQETREAVESALKLDAANRGANAIIKYYFTTERKPYQAGTGPKGNPYYRNKTFFSGEAVAVVTEEKAKPFTATTNTSRDFRARKPEFRKFRGTSLVLDGNNIVGASRWSMEPMRTFVMELKKTGYDFHVFFDNSIRITASRHDLLQQGQEISDALSAYLDLKKNSISVATGRAEADSFIIEKATRTNAAIVTNDNYDDYKAEYPWLNENERLLKFQVFGSEVLVPRLTIHHS